MTERNNVPRDVSRNTPGSFLKIVNYKFTSNLSKSRFIDSLNFRQPAKIDNLLSKTDNTHAKDAIYKKEVYPNEKHSQNTYCVNTVKTF